MGQRDRAYESYLVAAARTGDARALARLADFRGPRLVAHAARLLGDREVAQDMVQEAWIEILRGLGSLRDDTAFLPWALRIVSRRVAREIARRQRSRRLAESVGAETDPSVPEAGPAGLDAARVRAAVAALPPAQAATIALFYLEDLTVAEVATALDVPVGTVKTRLMHARARLREILEGNHNGQA